MNEKNEIIFISEYAADKIAFGRQDFLQISVGIKSYNINDVPYILKSKYDELLYRLGEVECYVIDLRREKDELSLENARLAADLAKVQSELEKVKGENEILSRPISQEPLIAKDVPCTCDWQKVYPHLSVKCNPSSCKKTK